MSPQELTGLLHGAGFAILQPQAPPLLTYLAEDREDQRQCRGLVGEASDDVGPPAHFQEGPLQRVRRPEALPVARREAEEAPAAGQVRPQDLHRRREDPAVLLRELPRLGLGLFQARGIPDPVQGLPDLGLPCLGYPLQDVPGPVHDASLPRHLGPVAFPQRGDEAGVPIDHDQVRQGQPPRPEGPRGPASSSGCSPGPRGRPQAGRGSRRA